MPPNDNDMIPLKLAINFILLVKRGDFAGQGPDHGEAAFRGAGNIVVFRGLLPSPNGFGGDSIHNGFIPNPEGSGNADRCRPAFPIEIRRRR